MKSIICKALPDTVLSMVVGPQLYVVFDKGFLAVEKLRIDFKSYAETSNVYSVFWRNEPVKVDEPAEF